MSQFDFKQLLTDAAGLLKKPKQSSRAHGVSEDHWETFCVNHSIKCCEAKAMNSSAATAWEGRRSSVFLRLGGLMVSIQTSRQNMSPKARRRHRSFDHPDFWMRGWTWSKKWMAAHALLPLLSPTPMLSKTIKLLISEKKDSMPPLRRLGAPANHQLRAPAKSSPEGTSKRLPSAHKSQQEHTPGTSCVLSWEPTTPANSVEILWKIDEPASFL
jgi:hypothetical protein